MTLNTNSQAETMGEYGTITNLNDKWQTITLNQNYINPVVIVSDPTFNGQESATVRLKNVTGNSFELRIQEGESLDDNHVLETASYLVVEAGDWKLSDGTRISAGTQNSNLLSSQGFETVGISEFDQTPTLLTQVQTYNGPHWVITRTKNMTANSFDLTMQEEEALNDGTHATETIGWLAIDQGMGTDGDTLLQGGLTEKTHTDIQKTVNFEQAFSETPIVFAKLGSYFGPDPANIRLGSISNSGFEAIVHEDKSHDTEIEHVDEQIAFLALGDSSGLLTGYSAYGSPPTDLDLDNTTLDENATPNSVVGQFSTTDPDNGDSFTYALVSGTGDTDNSAFTISGNQLQINTTPDFESQSSYSIRVETTDGSGASYQKQLTINVNDVNEAPTDLDLDNTTLDENATPNSVVRQFSTTDPDTGDTFTYSLVSGTGDTDNSAFTISGDQLKINSSPDYETQSSYDIRVKTTDAAGESYQKQLTINVNDVNEAPTDLLLDNTTLDENATPNSVVGQFSTTDPDNGDSFTYALVSGTGDTDNSAFTISGNQLQINTTPNFESQSSYSIRVETTDGEGASYQEELTINVNDVNEAPTDLDLDNTTLEENVAANSVVGTFSTTDPDSGDSFTYTLVTGDGDTDNSAFTINGDQLKINDSPDYETKSSYSVRVQTTDGDGASHTEQLTINVNDVNEAPTDLDLDNKTIEENVAANSVVGTFSTTDPDSGDSFTYTLVTGDGDTDNSAFTINGDQLQINDSPDYETKSSYNIRVQTTDGEGASYQEELTINVNDVNEPPTDLDLDNKTIDENVEPNSVVGTFSTTDPDSGDSFTYTLVTGDGDTDNSAFTINGDQLKRNDSPDYETKSSYNIRVQTTDGEGASYQEELTINVNDVNEAPTDLDLDNKTIEENVAANSVVGTFSTTDPDSGDSFTYTLVTGDGDTDNSAFTINGDQLQINDSPDYETKSSYNIRVQTTDGSGAIYQEELTINVNDIIEGTPRRDTLTGTDYNDVIIGFQGRDIITGGEGEDQFVYINMRDTGDIITDFEVGSDKIVLTELFNSIGYSGSSPINDGYVSFSPQGENTVLLIDADGTGGRRASNLLKVENVNIDLFNNSDNFVF